MAHAAGKKALFVVLGPTASGKTGFSISLAQKLGNTEIINADSRQLYRHLDIGTAKITEKEMRGIPHHLIDVLDPTQEVTASWYRDEAMKTIDAIHARGNVPVLVGGSMLYISAIIDGLAFPVASDPALRKKLSDEYDADEGVSLHARLAEIDPDTAQGLPRQNKPYVIRAMELHELGGKKPADLREKTDCPYDLCIIGIERSREELVKRIDKRTVQLLTGGWIGEVRELIAKGYKADDPGMKSHGYREIMQAITSGNTDIEALAHIIAAKTRQYAKRQMTWWKHDERINWITP